jgi:hypothetical protein
MYQIKFIKCILNLIHIKNHFKITKYFKLTQKKGMKFNLFHFNYKFQQHFCGIHTFLKVIVIPIT